MALGSMPVVGLIAVEPALLRPALEPAAFLLQPVPPCVFYAGWLALRNAVLVGVVVASLWKALVRANGSNQAAQALVDTTARARRGGASAAVASARSRCPNGTMRATTRLCD